MREDIKIIVGLMIVGTCYLNPAWAEELVKPIDNHITSHSKTSLQSINKPQRQSSESKHKLVKMPFYVPPLRGAPAHRVGGGTRSDQASIILQALSPDHIGRTTQSQPTLYFYQSKKIPMLAEFILIEKKSEIPIVEQEFQTSNNALQSIKLDQFNVKLQENVEYLWYISIIVDTTRRAKDIVSGGSIQYTAAEDNLKNALLNSNINQHSNLFASAGIWYDAIDAAQHNGNTNNHLLALTYQIGLKNINLQAK